MGVTTGSTIRCADGTEISIDWVYPDAPDYEWVRDRSHWPEPGTPIELWLGREGIPGQDRAWDEVQMTPPHMFVRFQMLGPFLYARMTPYPPERMMEIAPRYMEVSREYGGGLAFWKQFCEPRIMKAADELSKMPADADLRAAAELWRYGLHQTFTCLPLLFIPNMQLSAMLTEYNVADVELTSFELTQGAENATQAIDFEIWELAEIARKTPAVAKILESTTDAALDALRREPAAAAFMAAFDDLIARHGRRSQGWVLTAETWAERPDAALALVRAQVGVERVSPAELRQRTTRRREEATKRVLSGLPAERHEEFRSIIKELEGYVEVREGRAYWQLVISGAVRGLVLRLGSELVRAGRIEDKDDVFYITPDDINDPSSDLRARAAAGRADLERWRHVEPPPFIGTPGEVSADAAAKRAELRGAPASRGQATGTARILHGPDEGSKLQRGDILVCVMTTPAWTPLFAIAGGIITETGGALSHPAITAREYGIPAVVALEGALSRIRDGQTVTIDGGAGTVSTD